MPANGSVLDLRPPVRASSAFYGDVFSGGYRSAG